MDASERAHVTAERPLDGAWLSFDLPVMPKRIKAEETWRSGSRNAMTMMKSRGQRIVLIAMHGKTEIPMHRAAVEIVGRWFLRTAHAVCLSRGQKGRTP